MPRQATGGALGEIISVNWPGDANLHSCKTKGENHRKSTVYYTGDGEDDG